MKFRYADLDSMLFVVVILIVLSVGISCFYFTTSMILNNNTTNGEIMNITFLNTKMNFTNISSSTEQILSFFPIIFFVLGVMLVLSVFYKLSVQKDSVCYGYDEDNENKEIEECVENELKKFEKHIRTRKQWVSCDTTRVTKGN